MLSNRGGFYHPAVYLEEAKRMGIEVRLPDVNKSCFNYTVEGDAIRVGFLEIRNLSQRTIEALIEAREERSFRSLSDLYRRARCGRADAEALIQAGACDDFGEGRHHGCGRPALFWELRTLLQANTKPKERGDSELFVDEDPALYLPGIPDYSRKRYTDSEWTALGLTVTTHPIEYYLSLLTEHALVLSKDLPEYAGRIVVLFGWLIAERRVGLKNRGCMKFLTLEDPAGVFEAVLFPAVYQRCGHLLDSHGPFFLTGEVQEEDQYCSLIVDHLERRGIE